MVRARVGPSTLLCAQRRPLFASHHQFYRCPFALLSLTHSLASLFFFIRTVALNLNSGSLGVSLLLMRPSLVNSYRAPLVDTEGELITKYVVIIIRETTMCGWVVDWNWKRLAWLWLDGVMGCVAALLSFFQCEKGTVDSARSFARRCPKSSVSKEVNVAGVVCPGFEQV